MYIHPNNTPACFYLKGLNEDDYQLWKETKFIDGLDIILKIRFGTMVA